MNVTIYKQDCFIRNNNVTYNGLYSFHTRKSEMFNLPCEGVDLFGKLAKEDVLGGVSEH